MSLIYEYGKDKEQKGFDEGIKKGINEGIRKGINEGKSREQERIITNLLKSNLKPKQIAKATKTPLSKINAIKKKYNITT